MKAIYTLVDDIYELVKRKDGRFSADIAEDFSRSVQSRVTEQYQLPGNGEGNTTRRGLRLSQMGARCPRALWYSVHHPELAHPVPPWTEIKFTYGHVLEALLIAYAKAAGHTVEGEQDAVSLEGITGHRDCVIDGCIVDVKSASSYTFDKFKSGLIEKEDLFGYMEQLDGYAVASYNDPIVTVKDKAYDLVVNQVLGHIYLHEHTVREEHIRKRIEEYKKLIGLSVPPNCQCGTTTDGKSGNIKLDIKAGYSSYKFCCFPNLRTFLYASGPVYLTRVVRKPDVIEIDKFNKVVYN